ncbi:hypothetical protein AB8E26_20560 [Stenotrophomonas rhizophila]|nr:hypothetical protein [Stenotrophomonas sp. 364]
MTSVHAAHATATTRMGGVARVPLAGGVDFLIFRATRACTAARAA